MKKFYNKLSKSNKIIFLVLTIPLVLVVGSIIGFTLGLYAINFIPDQCATEGVVTTCQNPFVFMGMRGYEGTSFLGLVVCALASLTAYLVVLFRPGSKNNG